MFVDRTKSGEVQGTFACRQYVGQEEIADDHPDVLAYRAPKPPILISNAQLKRQLEADGLLSAARDAVKQMDGLAEELWYGAGMFLRDDPLLVQLAKALGYDSEEKLVAFFTEASKR